MLEPLYNVPVVLAGATGSGRGSLGGGVVVAASALTFGTWRNKIGHWSVSVKDKQYKKVSLAGRWVRNRSTKSGPI